MSGKGYGMPSSHAQFIFFFAVYLSLWLSFRVQWLRHHNKYPLVAVLLAMALSVASSRIYLFYHTSRQVGVGIAAGTFLAVFWFIATGLLRSMSGGVLWDYLLDNPFSNWAYIKDVSRDAMIQEQEWKAWREMQKRKKALSQKEE